MENIQFIVEKLHMAGYKKERYRKIVIQNVIQKNK